MGIVPLSVYIASRCWGITKQGASIAGLLAIGPSLSYFEWLLRYGTLGFAFSVGLLPITLAFCARLAFGDVEARWRDVLILLILSFCSIAWTLSAMSFIPVVLIAAALFVRSIKAREVFSSGRWKKLVAFALFFLVINGPWLTVFFRESKVLSFVSGQTMPGSDTRSVHDSKQEGANAEKEKSKKIKQVYKHFQQSLAKVNPIVFLFFIPGLLLVRRKSYRVVISATILWLILVATVGDYYKPQLELRRMIIAASFLMCVPAGAALYAFMARTLVWIGEDSIAKKAIGLSTLVLLIGASLASPMVAGAHYVNRYVEHYRFAPDGFEPMSDAIKEHGGEGRTLVLGFILHDFGARNYASQDGGHIAPLTLLSGKEMYASDFYHTRWSTVDPIPAAYRKRDVEGIEEFLDLINVTAVVAFKREWIKYCDSHEQYKEVYRDGKFRLYTRQTKSLGYFLRGEGELSSAKDGFNIVPSTKESVLKYKYHPRLVSNFPEEVSISPSFAFREEIGGKKTQDVSFIKLSFSERLIKERQPVHIGFYPENQ
jgi:hypothetical protein